MLIHVTYSVSQHSGGALIGKWQCLYCSLTFCFCLSQCTKICLHYKQYSSCHNWNVKNKSIQEKVSISWSVIFDVSSKMQQWRTKRMKTAKLSGTTAHRMWCNSPLGPVSCINCTYSNVDEVFNSTPQFGRLSSPNALSSMRTISLSLLLFGRGLWGGWTPCSIVA